MVNEQALDPFMLDLFHTELETQARVLEAGQGKVASVAAGLDDLEHLTRDIQESVMAIRAQPVRPLFQRMARG